MRLGQFNPIERSDDGYIEQQARVLGEPGLPAFDPQRLQQQLAESPTPESVNAPHVAQRIGSGVPLACAGR